MRLFVEQFKKIGTTKTEIDMNHLLDIILVLDDEKRSEIKISSVGNLPTLQIWSDGKLVIEPIAQNMVQITKTI